MSSNRSKRVDSIISSVFSQKLKEFYWTVTRAVGLGFLHDGSGYKHLKRLLKLRKSLLGLLFYPLYVLPARFSVTRAFDSLVRPSM